jgi:hypothetical protein
VPAIASRIDLARTGLAGMAAIIAGLSAVLYASDSAVNFPTIIVPFLALAGVTAAALAVLPSRGTWSVNRRATAALVATIWAICDIPVGFLGLLVATGCACASEPGYVAPDLLGLGTDQWVVLALLAGPLLLLGAASPLPDRLVHIRRHA